MAWSLEAIAAKFKVAPANWLHQDQSDFDCQDLPDRNRHRQRNQETQGQYQTGISIEKRPTAGNQRKTFGHWEVDTVLSSRGQSITVDHGKEFAQYQDLEWDYGLTTYSWHPYSPWEWGCNEYFNRKLRWFFPKKTNFDQMIVEQVLETVELINNCPLKLYHFILLLDCH